MTRLEAAHLATVNNDHSKRLVAAQHGHRELGADPLDLGDDTAHRLARAVALLVGDIEDLDRAALRRRLGGQGLLRVERQRVRAQVLDELAPRARVRDEVISVVAAHQQQRERRIAQPGRVLEDGLEHGLVIGRRAVDDPQDLTGRGLARPRVAEFLCELCHFFSRGYATAPPYQCARPGWCPK